MGHGRLVRSARVRVGGFSAIQEAEARTLLTPREAQILDAIADGLTNKAIARRLGISLHTVKFHVESVFRKLGASTRPEAVAKATERRRAETIESLTAAYPLDFRLGAASDAPDRRRPRRDRGAPSRRDCRRAQSARSARTLPASGVAVFDRRQGAIGAERLADARFGKRGDARALEARDQARSASGCNNLTA